MSGFFDDMLSAGLDLGKQYVQNEINDHGNQQPVVRPDTESVPSKTVQPTKAESDIKKVMIGGGVLVGVLVLVLVLKK